MSTSSRSPGLRRIVVGVDGSSDGRRALRAAARIADAEGAELHVVAVWHEVPAAVPGGRGVDAEGLASGLCAGELATVFGDAVPDRVTTSTMQGDPARCLMTAAADAGLLVLGARGRGGFPGLLLGSVALLCVLHAPCPVLVVRRDEPLPTLEPDGTSTGRRVVVGVDGPTPRTVSAVRAALRAAHLLRASVEVVSAWQRPDALPEAETAVVARIAAAAQERQDAALAAVGPAPAGTFVRTALRQGSPAGVLVGAADDAELLVVGSDSRNTMTGALLGPVALTAVTHAACPVLVMRGGRRA